MDSSGGTSSSSSPSALAGLPAFWDNPSTPPKIEWKQCWDIFVVVVNAKHFISIPQLMRTPTENHPRLATLINNMNEHAAERKICEHLIFVSGSPHDRTVATTSLNEIKDNFEDTFRKHRNRTLDRFKFFSRKQQPNETLRQFWNVLKRLAARCEFEQQTENLIMDTFFQNMHNKILQQRLCTEPKKSHKKR